MHQADKLAYRSEKGYILWKKNEIDEIIIFLHNYVYLVVF